MKIRGFVLSLSGIGLAVSFNVLCGEAFATAPEGISPAAVLLECEQFKDLGGWLVDSQFIGEMGSSYLLAHGLGKSVADAKTSFRVEQGGAYAAWVRAKDWTAKWRKIGNGNYRAAGRFQLTVDDALPAGNVIVDRVEGDTVYLHPDLRDTAREWFYWKFRVMGAEGRTLHFKFTKPNSVGSRSAAVSLDHGRTWRWADEVQPSKTREQNTGDHPDREGFDWTFGEWDHEVWFCQTIPYDLADWRAFIARHKQASNLQLLETGILCKSLKGRDIPYARFGRLDGKARERIFISSRHHCGETTATFVVEGLLAQVFVDDDLGRWLRENVEFRVVPFVDFDGVVDGDQGKGRKPHDHARDYNENRPVLYPEVRTIMAMLKEWRPTVVNDFHCPWLRGSWFQENNSNEFAYQVGLDHAENWARQKAFGSILERVQTAGVGYRQSDDYWYGRGWNAGANYTQGKTLIAWAVSAFPQARLVTTFEIPFANARFKTLHPSEFRAFGRDLAHAYRIFIGN